MVHGLNRLRFVTEILQMMDLLRTRFEPPVCLFGGGVLVQSASRPRIFLGGRDARIGGVHIVPLFAAFSGGYLHLPTTPLSRKNLTASSRTACCTSPGTTPTLVRTEQSFEKLTRLGASYRQAFSGENLLDETPKSGGLDHSGGHRVT